MVIIIEVLGLTKCSPATSISASTTIATATLPPPTSPMPTHTRMPATPTTAMTPSHVQAEKISVEIFAHLEWQPTGMIVKAGEPITIQSSGSWNHSAAEASYGSGGIEWLDTNSVYSS